MSDLEIERLGGLAGFGPKSRVKSRGGVDYQSLSEQDKASVERLFATDNTSISPGQPDAFRYKITRQTPAGPQTVEVPDHLVPQALTTSVRDQLE